MQISQHVYFALSSETVRASDITGVLRVEPDSFSVRGSRRTRPRPVPYCHRWEVKARRPDTPIDDQVDAVLDRLVPHQVSIGADVDADEYG